MLFSRGSNPLCFWFDKSDMAQKAARGRRVKSAAHQAAIKIIEDQRSAAAKVVKDLRNTLKQDSLSACNPLFGHVHDHTFAV